MLLAAQESNGPVVKDLNELTAEAF
jgi:hypothetical protein